MLKQIPKVLTEDHAAAIAQQIGPRSFFEPLIEPIVTTLRQYAKLGTQHPAYCVVEAKPDGHDWHTDTGNKDHMRWCEYAATILLTPPALFTGGAYRTREQSYHHYCDALLTSSDVEHSVEPSVGDRRVLLMFFA